MSSTNRGAERLPDDAYYTPAWCVHRLIEEAPLPARGQWLEPGAGDGAIIRAVNERVSGVQWTAVEKREECRLALTETAARAITANFLYPDLPAILGHFDVAIGNPVLVGAGVHRALHVARDGDVHALAAAVHRERSAGDIHAQASARARPSFTPDGKTDSTDYGWFAWGPGFSGVHVLASTPVEERKPRTARKAAE